MSGSWREWHEAYDQPDSSLIRRLLTVQRMIRAYLDQAPDGPVRVVSLCSGEGRDLVGALGDHPRRDDVRAILVEFDAELADRARRRAREAEIPGLNVIVGDAGLTENVTPSLPADLVLACGVFGNIPDDDIHTTIRALSHFGPVGTHVIWTRHRYEPDFTPIIRGWFRASGFDEVQFVRIPDSHATVGHHVLSRVPSDELAPGRMFQFFADRFGNAQTPS